MTQPTILPVLADYTDKDFDAIQDRLFGLLQQAFPEWTDHSRADFGNVLVGMFAHVGDILGFYQDNQAGEGFITTARLRSSLIALARLVSYPVPTAAAATAEVVLSIPQATSGDVEVLAGDVVRTEDVADPVRFQLLSGAVILAGATEVAALVENSSTMEDLFATTGQPSQELLLSEPGYLSDTAVVTDSLGAYTEVRNFLDSTPADRHYRINIDANDRARLVFGDGVQGVVPTGDVAVRYKVGGGARGRVPAGAIKVLERTFTDTNGNSVDLRVTNPAASSGGANRPSKAQLQQAIPEHVRAVRTTVAREDFEINARRLLGVSRALALTKNQDGGIPENTTYLYILPRGGGTPSPVLKAQVLTQVTVTYPCTTTHKVEVRSPTFKTIHVVVYVHFTTTPATVRARIVAALQGFFAPELADGTPNPVVDFGGRVITDTGAPDPTLSWSDVFNVIRDTTGVRKVEATAPGLLLNGVRADVPLAPTDFPVLGTVQVYNAATGGLV